jgi:hypothetical protein
VAGLDDHPPVVPPELGRRPRLHAARRAGEVEPEARHARHLQGHAAEAGRRRGGGHHRREDDAFPRGRHEAGGGRAEHHAVAQVAVATPEQLGDGAAERVADDDHRARAHLHERLGAVVGAVGEAEDPAAAHPTAVAAQVGSDDVEVLAERLERGVPVEPGAGQPSVEQQHGRRAGRAGDFAYEGGATAGKLDPAAERQRWSGHAPQIRNSACPAGHAASFRPVAPLRVTR